MIYAIIFLFATYFIGYDYVINRGIDEKMFLYVLIGSVSLLTLMSLIVLINEYVRMLCVSQKYKELLGDKYKQKDYKELNLNKISSLIMEHKFLGQVTNFFVFILGGILLLILFYKLISI